jgi:DNA-binding beta-propeller fold protein YncE
LVSIKYCGAFKFIFILLIMLGQTTAASALSTPKYVANKSTQVTLGSTAAYAYAETISHSNPFYIAISSKGDIYVTERDNNRVQKINSTGTYVICSLEKTDSRMHVDKPDGIDIDSSDNVYIADAGNNRILEFNSEGQFVKEFIGTKDSGSFSRPMGVAVDDKGNVYIADSSNSVIKTFDKDGAFLKSWGTGLASPESISVDQSGIIYVGDEDTNSIHKYEAGGTQHTIFAPSGSGIGMVNDPEDLTVDYSGNIFVSDSGNNRVQKFTSQGEVETTLANAGTISDTFNHQRGVAVDKDGNLYVADTGNNRILKFIPNMGNIKVTVKDSHGIPIAGVKVLMVDKPDDQIATTGYTNSEGVSNDYGLLPGTYRYEISKAGYVTVTTDSTTVVAGATSDITVTLSGGTPTTGNIQVTVLDLNGLPILGAHVESGIWPNVQTILSSTSDSSHVFLFSDVLPGEYQMKASKNFFVTGRSDIVRVEAGGTVEVTITLQAQLSTGDLEITVKDPYGVPVSEATVTIDTAPDMQLHSSDSTNVNGLVIFTNVLPGDYVLKVQKVGFDDTLSGTVSVVTGRSTDVVITLHHRVLDKFVFEAIANTQKKDVEFDVTIKAVDPYGEKLEAYSGTNTLSGSGAQISPTSIEFMNGVFRGKVKVLEASSSMRLITTSSDAKTGESNSFEVLLPDSDNRTPTEISCEAKISYVAGFISSWTTPEGFTILGSITPPLPNRSVKIEILRGQPYDPDILRFTNTASDGTYHSYWKKDGAGHEEEFEVRVSWEGDSEYKGSTKTIIFPFPKSGFPCIIATATYGSSYASEVVYMRHVRDDLIGSNGVGKTLVTGWNKFYYMWSPPIAYTISGSPQLRFIFTILLLPLLGTMHVVDFVFNSLVWFNPELASIIGFLAAAIISIGIYILIPIILFKTIITRAKKKQI